MDADAELRMKEGGYKVAGKDSEGEGEEENAFASFQRLLLQG